MAVKNQYQADLHRMKPTRSLLRKKKTIKVKYSVLIKTK